MVKENVVYYVPACAYNTIHDLAETITNPANCRFSTLIHSIKDNFNIAHPETVCLHGYYHKNLVGETYVRQINSLHFPSDMSYHRFDVPL